MTLVKSEFLLGATYEWGDLDCKTTSKAREFLLNQLKHRLNHPFMVIEQRVGIRPILNRSRPFFARYDRCIVTNGLGYKGVLYAPRAAK